MHKDLHSMIAYAEQTISSKVLHAGKQQITLFCMAAGTSIAEHTTEKEGFAYVIEGDGIFRIEETDLIMKPGILIPIAKGKVHALSASKDTAFLLVLS
jgi:quercetin dioxygenase-like cupin family protein